MSRPETTIPELSKETKEQIQKLVDQGGYDAITVDVDAPITYTIKNDGRVVGVFRSTFGDHEGLAYPQFAMVQEGHIMALDLFNRFTNQATQFAAKAQSKRVTGIPVP